MELDINDYYFYKCLAFIKKYIIISKTSFEKYRKLFVGLEYKCEDKNLQYFINQQINEIKTFFI